MPEVVHDAIGLPKKTGLNHTAGIQCMSNCLFASRWFVIMVLKFRQYVGNMYDEKTANIFKIQLN